MTVEFIDIELKNLYTGEFKGKPGFNETVIYQYRKVINLIRSAENFESPRSFKSLRIHKLKETRKRNGQQV